MTPGQSVLTASTSMPSTTSTLRRLVTPPSMVMWDGGTPSASATRATRPPVGGAIDRCRCHSHAERAVRARALDPVGATARRQAHRERRAHADLDQEEPQKDREQDDQDERRQIDHARAWQDATDGRAAVRWTGRGSGRRGAGIRGRSSSIWRGRGRAGRRPAAGTGRRPRRRPRRECIGGRGQPRGRSPKSARPTRTSVRPPRPRPRSRRSCPSRGPRRAPTGSRTETLESSRSRDERRASRLGPLARADPRSSGPASSRCGRCESARRGPARSAGAKPSLAGSASTLTWR